MLTTSHIAKEMPPVGAPMDPLQAKTARNTFGDILRATPRKARAWVASTFRTLHLDGAVSAAGSGASWIFQRLLRAGRFVRGLGLVNLAVAVLTTPAARRAAASVAAKAYRIARKPFSLLGRGLKWVFGKVGFSAGVKAIEAVESRIVRVESYVAGKVNAGLDWMDHHQAQTVPTISKTLQGLSYGAILSRLVRAMFPQVNSAFRLTANIVGGFAWGYKTWRATQSEDAAIANAKVVLADAQPATTVVTEPVGTTRTYILSDTERPATSPTFEAEGFVDPKGTVRIFLGTQLLTVDDLPDGVTLVGEHKGEILVPAVEATVRAAQATTTGRPPTLPRAAQRVAAKKTGGARRR